MNSIEMFFDSDEEENEDVTNLVVTRKHLRDRSNPLEMPDSKFISNFRLSKEAFKFLLDEITRKLPVSLRCFSVPPILKLSATLLFFSQGSYQQGIGDSFNLGLAQPTMSKIIKKMLVIFENYICPQWIKFDMTDDEQLQAKLYFYNKTGFPGIIGCVDGTHIKILTPNKEVQHFYYNRKEFYSLNAMLVCDHRMRFRYVDANHPGACHDAFVWNGSAIQAALKQKYESGDTNTWLLGDSGYPLEPFLITPFKTAPEGSRESLFNTKHASARNIIERSIGVLKNRFRCLLDARQLHYLPEKSIQITNACVALHNICVHYKTDIEENINLLNSDDTLFTEMEDAVSQIADNSEAISIRNQIFNSIC